MAIEHGDLAILVARTGAERCGTSRCGFAPRATTTETGEAPGPFYLHEEFKQDEDGTVYTVVRD